MREKANLEAEATRRRAEVDANLHVLQIQRAAVAASAEAEVYEAALELDGESNRDLTELDIEDAAHRAGT